MDPQEFEYVVERLRCVKQSNVQYFDSRQEEPDNERLDEAELLEKVRELKQLIAHPADSTSPRTRQNGPFILISTNGDHIYSEARALRISKTVLRTYIEAGIFPRQMIAVCQLKCGHFSHHVQYDEETDIPVAIYIMLRVPRLNRLITLIVRIELITFTTIVLLTSVNSTIVASLRTRCIRQSSLLTRHPLHILTFILEHRMREFEEDIEYLWHKVETLDLKTGIEPGWRGVHGREKVKHEEDFTQLLRELHEVGTEIRLMHKVTQFGESLGTSFRKLIKRIEELRDEVGAGSSKKRIIAELEDQLAYVESRVKMTAEKFEACKERVQAQINVTYSLIAQNSSEQNIRIARLTAQDSQTMKTITVLTLTFLPSTMLASLWDAGIFTLPQDKSWKVYVGTSCALTVIVFALWLLYSWTKRGDGTTGAVEQEKKQVQGV